MHLSWKKLFIAVLLIVGGVYLGHWYFFPPVDNVDVTVSDVRSPDLGLTSASVGVGIKLENNADRKIPSPSLSYEIYLNNERIGTGRTTFSSLKSGESRTRTVDARIDYADVGDSIGQAIRNGEFSIKINGKLKSRKAVEEISLSY